MTSTSHPKHESGPIPALDNIRKNVYWESDHDTEASLIGWHFFDTD